MQLHGSPDFTAVVLARATALVLETVNILSADDAMCGRNGCAVCVARIADPDTLVPLLVAQIGFVDTQKMRRYVGLAQEKVGRLKGRNRERGHRLSRESADQDMQQYPGAVAGGSLLVGISGFPADVDELLSAALLVHLGDLTRDEAKTLLTQAGNAYIDRFPALCDTLHAP